MKREYRLFIAILALTAAAAAQPVFKGQELLGRITNNSVTVNVSVDRDLEVYFEYGAFAGTYTSKTTEAKFTGGTPFEVVMDKLQPNTKYYYRMQYREPGTTAFTARDEHFFTTQRPRGSTFTFVMQFDPHMDENSDPATYKLTLANELAGKPDFMIDLGDTMMSDKLQPVTQPAVMDRTLLLRSYYDLLCHSVPLFMALGNHEGEWGKNLTANGQNVAIWDTLARKQYYPNPVPDSFFSGDTHTYPLVGQRQAYYSWEWGDALLVVLDPYWAVPVAPELSNDWSVTLGRTQYDWLKQTLETSTATYKFVFSHNLIGGVNPNGLGAMRGGIEAAKFLEWGGYNLDGTWGFDKARPGWPMPIHQLLVANNVTAYFHGHDHVYVKQDLDGIVYQEGPQPSARNTNLGTRATDYTYTHGTQMGGTGYLRATVSPTNVKVEYVQTWIPSLEKGTTKNGMIADTYTIPARKTNLKFASAASYAGGNVAPESIVAAYGSVLANSPVVVKDSAGAERNSVVLGAAPTQVNFVVPAGTVPGRAVVTVASNLGDIVVDTVAPGLFSANADGKGAAAASVLHAKTDGTQSTELIFKCGTATGSCATVPIDMGSATDQLYLTLYGTGIRNRADLKDVTATIGGQSAVVTYAGSQPAFAGLDQVNLLVPRSLVGRGEVPIFLSVAGRNTNSVTINLR